jgi:DNA (cytosine-5)-methyltransferase 1
VKKPRALDLFCGAGGASRGLADAGFEVYGVDIAKQPNYPFWFKRGDAMEADLSGYDFIWASPPCQAFTLAQRIQKNEHPDLIAPIRNRLIASGVPFVIENVPGAPLINPIELCGSMFGLRTYRHRLFECSFPIAQPAHPAHEAKTTKMGRKPKPGEFLHVVGNFSGVKEAKEAMGIDWMVRNEMSEAIPPAYSRYIAQQFLTHVHREAA